MSRAGSLSGQSSSSRTEPCHEPAVTPEDERSSEEQEPKRPRLEGEVVSTSIEASSSSGIQGPAPMSPSYADFESAMDSDVQAAAVDAIILTSAVQELVKRF